MHTLMDNRIKNIVESFDFSKLNNNHPKNTKAVDQIRKTILWKMKQDGKYGKEKQQNKK